MESHLLCFVFFLVVAAAASQASLSPEGYWKTMLPNTPMPKAVTSLLKSEFMEGESTSVNVGNGGVNVDAGKGQPGGTSVHVGGGGVNVDAGGTNVNVGHGGVGVNTGKPGRGTHVGVGKGVSVNTGPKGKHVYVSPFIYKYAASEDQLHDDPTVALFFLEKDMHPGGQMNLHFTKDSDSATFLPRQEAESKPFSSSKLPAILNAYSVKPGSEEAEVMKNTIEECEEPGIKGEDKYCATSLESMIDFSVSKLGKHPQAISTDVEKETEMQKYTISAGVKKMASEKSVACHKQQYPYAVFYCHTTDATKVYAVPLVGADGTKAKAVAVCHTDTASWNPKHLAFQVLNVRPGAVPVCHFLPEDHIVWITN